jgi:hypothetical protein
MSGGADVSHGGSLVLAELGTRVASYEGLLRVGRASGGTAIDLLVRWSPLGGRLSPILGIGYAFSNGTPGYVLNGGLRLELAQGERLGLALIADFGLRVYSSTDAMGTTTTGLAYPLEVSAEVYFH